MSLRYKGITDLFTKLGKQPFDIWFSGKYREGEYKIWYKTGQIIQHSSWKNGKRNGEFKEWRTNGKLSVRCFFKNNKRNGEYKKWRANGEMWEHSVWKNGKKVRDIQ